MGERRRVAEDPRQIDERRVVGAGADRAAIRERARDDAALGQGRRGECHRPRLGACPDGAGHARAARLAPVRRVGVEVVPSGRADAARTGPAHAERRRVRERAGDAAGAAIVWIALDVGAGMASFSSSRAASRSLVCATSGVLAARGGGGGSRVTAGGNHASGIGARERSGRSVLAEARSRISRGQPGSPHVHRLATEKTITPHPARPRRMADPPAL
jgi:hypothetical protein